MRVMKAGVKSKFAHTPKSEFFTSSHVEYLMSEQAGDGRAARGQHRHKNSMGKGTFGHFRTFTLTLTFSEVNK
jgi:hypothetical protein